MTQTKSNYPILTIVTVCLNASGTISRCLESIESQESKNFEHIIIDGGSEDGTRNIIMSRIQKYHRIIFEKDEGIYDAMNKGLRNSKGLFVLFLNSDDELMPKTTKIFEQYLLQNPDADVLYGSCYVVDNQKNERLLKVPVDQLLRTMTPHPSTFIRAQKASELNGFNSNFRVAADFDLMSRFIRVNNKIICVDGVLSRHFEGGYSDIHWVQSQIENIRIQMNNHPFFYRFGVILPKGLYLFLKICVVRLRRKIFRPGR